MPAIGLKPLAGLQGWERDMSLLPGRSSLSLVDEMTLS